ncbi:HNH endonuclease signature motif containing protein [Humibacillus xanthopallidus]|uniref:Uncharacterized protein DUF222 n=1 Tax=Humibacillus xanthopallidus TaxID=412689 RepID=A0A543H8B8_9MICO|nr:HNH endonuclease signature motif containing protein [Humibacillus xanthopallidus]TQM54586.1 uncharacterized protein DUF222 [Humibacillus xanthopallidus]
MAENADVLELLRSRLADLETRQRSGVGTSATDFWHRLTGGMPSGPSGPSAPDTSSATASGPSRPSVTTAPAEADGAGVWAEWGRTTSGPAEPGPSQGSTGTSRRRPSRRVAPQVRPVTSPRGPWSGVPAEVLDSIDPQGLEPLTETEWLAMVDDPDWIEATAARAATWDSDRSRADARQAVQLDAVVGRSLTAHADTDLAAAAERVAAQRATLEVTLVTIVSELVSRGVDTPDGLSRVDWLRRHDPSLTAAQAKALVTVGTALTDPRWAHLRLLVTTGQVTAGNAAQILDFHTRTAPVADDGDLTTALTDLTDQARQLRPEELARLVRHHTEQITPPRDQDDLDHRRRTARGLWFTPPNATGMVGLRGTLDPEGAAILKSAIDPLSLPHPERDEHGHTITADDRTPARRRMDALLAMLQRGVASADRVPTTDKAKVVVLIDLDTLLTDLSDDLGDHIGDDIPDAFRRKPPTSTRTGTATGTGTGTGITLSGDVLSPGVVRRMACDAQIIPMVLGGDSKPLDVGQRRRLFTRSQRLALGVRDKGCSWQGCTMPPSWCDAHHVTHWALGGPTDLLNAALLCPRHHTEVHRRNLTATVTAHGVTWHT